MIFVDRRRLLGGYRLLLFLLSFSLVDSRRLDAQAELEEKQQVRVTINHFPPFIIQASLSDSDGPTGFDIDLWQAIAADLDLSYAYRIVPTLKSLFNQLVAGQSDVSIGGLTITADREESVDFSHQYIEAGLQTLVRNEHDPSVVRALRTFLNPRTVKVLVILALFTLAFSHLVWWAERKQGEGYWDNILEWVWWLHVTIATVGYGDIAPKKWFGRLVGLLVIYTGIGFFLFCTAEFSSAITIEKLKADIARPTDLYNRPVATVRDSTSVPVLERIGARVVLTDQVETAYSYLLDGKVDAVIYDSPNLQHYARGENRVRVTGPIFEAQHYGIALQRQSPLRELVNRSILRLKENGEYQRIYQKWFSQVTH